MRRTRSTLILAALAAFVSSASPLRGGEAAPRPRNVVIVAADGLRADRMGLYGYRRHPTTPNIDRLARRAVVYLDAEAQTSWTLPSFATFFTSRYPHQHGAVGMNRPMAEAEVTLAELLHDAGYRTAGFVGGPFLEPGYGFAQGFDHYDAGGMRLFPVTVPPALDWIRKNKDRPFFVFIHGNDVHPPFNPDLPDGVRRRFDPDYAGPAATIKLDYDFVRVYNRLPSGDGKPPEPAYQAVVDAIRADPRSLEHISALYDGQVAQVDEWFGKIWKTLEEEGLADDTVVMLMADHGLEMGERGLLATGYHPTLYETITHVPLILWGTGLKPARVAGPVELTDAAPTLLAVLGLPSPDSFEGRSRLPGAGAPRRAAEGSAFAESSVVSPAPDILLRSLREGSAKIIHDSRGPKLEHYDLARDPGEKKDLSRERSADALRLSERLWGRLSGTP
jgi:arylsulfatase A-like enzyme